eukprot:g13193.t2
MKDCDVLESACLQDSAQAVKAMQTSRVLHAASCQDDMTWDFLHAKRSIFITAPGLVRDLCLFIVSRTHLIAVGAEQNGCCSGNGFAPQAGHIYLIKHIKCPQTQTLEVEMAALPSGKDTVVPRLATKMVLQAGGLRSVFLASWSLDPRAVTDEGATAGRAAAERIKKMQFTRGQPRYGAIDVGHVASIVGEGGAHNPDPACVLALVRALQYNTFFTHLDLSSANEAAGCWSGEDPAGTSDTASRPLALALQGLLGWNVTLQSFLAPKIPRGQGGSSLLNWQAIGSALLVNPRPLIATWDLTDCGIGDAGLTALLPAWWRIFSYIAPVRELRLSGNGLGQTGLAPFFNMLNGTGFTFSTPQGLAVPPGPLSTPNTSFLTRLELGGSDLRGAFPSLVMLISRCPFLRKLDLSNPLPAQGRAFGPQEAAGVFGALVNSLCPVEELDLRGHWGLESHTEMEMARNLAGLVARKPTLAQLSLGEMAFDASKISELDVPIAAAAVTTWGADIAADRKAHTVDLSNSQLLNWPPVGPAAPGALVLRSCAVSFNWYQGLLSFCTAPHSALRRLDISYSFFRLEPASKTSFATALGYLVASSPLEALIMPGDVNSNGINCIPGYIMALFFPALGMSKTLLELDVTGHGFGDVGCVPLGVALRQNRSITTLSYDMNLVALEGFKAIRGCLYGNKKLVNVSAPVADLAMRTNYLTAEIMEGHRRMREIKGRIKAAYKTNKAEFHRQIAIISANNKAWKALEREKNKTIEVTSVIAACIASNRQLKEAKDAGKSAAKMERQKDAFEERYATKMTKILTKISKETDKARLQAASTKTSPFQARPRTYFYTSKARKQQEWRQNNKKDHRRNGGGDDGGGGRVSSQGNNHSGSSGMYFVALPPMNPSPCFTDRCGGGGGGDGGTPDEHHQPGNGDGSASISPEDEELVDLRDNYVTGPEFNSGDSSNPLDSVRDLITQAGPKLFDPSNLGRIDDLFREAGPDVYERMGPILGEAGEFGSKVAETATSWGTDLGNIFSDIGESAGDAFSGLGGLFSDVGDALGHAIDEVGDWAGDALEDGVDAARDLAEDIGELAADGVGAVGELAEDIGDGIGDGLDAAGELAEDVGEGIGDGLDAARGLAEDAVDAVGDAIDGQEGEADDVDMYAGAGPVDLDDEGPTGGKGFTKVRSGPRRLVEAFAVQRTPVDTDRSLMGIGEWTASRLKAREGNRWEKIMIDAAKKVDRPEAFPYKSELHAFHGGQALPSQECRVTLVTQCSADRLHAVLRQALRWGGDISLAVYVPSAPLSASAKTLREVQRLCDTIDRAVQTADGDPASKGRYQHLSLDVAILEGAEVDPARHDHCGVLYPVNTLRNLALLQARDDNFHPAQAVFLVDSDCLPSESLLGELHSEEVQSRINSKRLEKTRGGMELPESNPTAVVVPCLEFVPGVAASRAKQHDADVPLSTRDMVEMLRKGTAQGFHVNYFYKGHGPTDFERWAAAATEETATALAYAVPFDHCFEPYVVVDKTITPLYDERFRGYAMNKVAHLLSLASGSPGISMPAEFVVLRKGFVFSLPHARSPGWEETYGPHADPHRRYQIKALWSKFQDEVIKGCKPVVSSSTAATATSLPPPPNDNYSPPPLPSYRVLRRSLQAVKEDASIVRDLARATREQQLEHSAGLLPNHDKVARPQNNYTSASLSKPGEEKWRADISKKNPMALVHHPLGFLPKKTSVVHPIAPAEGFGCLVASSSVGSGVGLAESRQSSNGRRA